MTPHHALPRVASACRVTAAAVVCMAGSAQVARSAVVTRNIGLTLSASALDSYNLDVDQNGTNDFTFETAYVPDPTLTVGFDQIRSLFGSGNGVVIDVQTGDGFPPASLLGPGATVSATRLFSTSGDNNDLYFYDTLDPISGNFGGKTGFVGFKFDGIGGTHFGYVQVGVKSLDDPAAPFDLTLGSVVYDTVAAAPLTVTPEPAVLTPVLLALAPALRRRRLSGGLAR